MNILIIPLLYIFGVLGMLGVSLIPMHLWSIAIERKIKYPLDLSRRSGFVVTLVLLPILFSTWFGSYMLPKVFLCLLEMQCGPNRAAGLINLAMFGVSVLAVEIFWLLAKILWSKWHGPRIS